eukprot:scaffold626_cov337-Pavlova_lutheri.AAC.44
MALHTLLCKEVLVPLVRGACAVLEGRLRNTLMSSCVASLPEEIQPPKALQLQYGPAWISTTYLRQFLEELGPAGQLEALCVGDACQQWYQFFWHGQPSFDRGEANFVHNPRPCIGGARQHDRPPCCLDQGRQGRHEASVLFENHVHILHQDEGGLLVGSGCLFSCIACVHPSFSGIVCPNHVLGIIQPLGLGRFSDQVRQFFPRSLVRGGDFFHSKSHFFGTGVDKRRLSACAWARQQDAGGKPAFFFFKLSRSHSQFFHQVFLAAQSPVLDRLFPPPQQIGGFPGTVGVAFPFVQPFGEHELCGGVVADSIDRIWPMLLCPQRPGTRGHPLQLSPVTGSPGQLRACVCIMPFQLTTPSLFHV